MKVKEYITKTTRPFCNQYDADSIVKNEDFQVALSEFIRVNYGRLNIRPAIEFEEYNEYWDEYDDKRSDAEIATEIKSICENVYSTNAYKYDHLYGTTVAEYDPIENYHMVESGTDTEEYGENGSHVQGQQVNSSSNTNTMGSQTNGRSETTNTGSQTSSDDTTTVKSVQPFNSQSLVQAEKDEVENDTTTGARQDSLTGSDTIGGRTDSGSATITSGQRNDTDALTGTKETTHEFSRSGNVGVTTSQQMLESERQLAMFNFYAVVATDLIRKIAIVLY